MTRRPAAGGPSSCRQAGTSPRSSAGGSTLRCTQTAPPAQALVHQRRTPRHLRRRLQRGTWPAARAAAKQPAAAAAGAGSGRGSRKYQLTATCQPAMQLSWGQARSSCCGRKAPAGGAATRSLSSSWPWRCDFLLPGQRPADPCHVCCGFGQQHSNGPSFGAGVLAHGTRERFARPGHIFHL